MMRRGKPRSAQVTERHARRENDLGDRRSGAALRVIEAARDGTRASERVLAEAVNAAREEGYSWTAIGAALGGVSKQAAQQRFASKPT